MIRPSEALFRLGFRCNQDCGFCWQGRDWQEPPTALYERWIDEVAVAGIRSITFSGGEPTIHPALPALVERAVRHGIAVALQTNAIQLAKAAFAARIVEAGVTALFGSYHSHRAEISDAMTAAPGTHVLTELGIARALDLGLAVSLNCVVERANVYDLEAYARHVVARFVRPHEKRGVKSVEFSHPLRYFRAEEYARASVSFDVSGPHVVAAARTLLDAGVGVAAVGTCGHPICAVRDEPRLLRAHDRTREMASDVTSRIFAPVCQGCAARSTCLGVRREYLDQWGDRGLVPFAAPIGEGRERGGR